MKKKLPILEEALHVKYIEAMAKSASYTFEKHHIYGLHLLAIIQVNCSQNCSVKSKG